MPTQKSNAHRRDLALEEIEHVVRQMLIDLHTLETSAEVILAEARGARKAAS